ncbi:TBC1 domain family member 2A [Dunckerocampus dactyliophorus]|uniref:TBC1 domain family member 2A n=1 Tax=Dunckerocampus dactyliophorus TaxID=161453 RepID=UPI00240641CC|nr:TBC1 domain family member 2A [Dunckerocampus dactyliophorus]XP_054649055.1 TBC1 domain family member 2A [Dunckerocampus dactyliophorus]XP_054649056.1 TBC1 domain family member 2A [Dunckerocampus dactyliophorus]
MSSSDHEHQVCQSVAHLSRIETHRNPTETHETHHIHPETHEMHQNPTVIYQIPSKTHETYGCPQATLLSPAKTHQTLSETDHSATESQEVNRIPPETHETYHSVTATLLCLTKTHETNQNPEKTYQSTTTTLLSPAKIHETKQSTTDTQPSPTQTYETHQIPPETHEIHQNPTGSHQIPSWTHEICESPTETHHNILETQQSRAKPYESDCSPPEIHKTQQRPGEEAQPLMEHHQGSQTVSQNNSSSPPKQEHESTKEQQKDSLVVSESFYQGETELAAEIFSATEKNLPEDQKNHHCSAMMLTSSTPVTHHFITQQAPSSADPDFQQVPAHLSGSSGEPKLCGFLQKKGGPLRAWKQRWFTYEENKNQLFYYRMPQDVMPLGRVDLSAATFTYPLKAETGTFHIKTPERTFILKAVNQELMLYWLQQLQVKRWQHRQTTSCPDSTNTTADEFLPLLKSPVGLVGEEAANVAPQRTPLSNMSIKHPFIGIQNSVHNLRKRSSREWPQSVFYVQTPAVDQVDTTNIMNCTGGQVVQGSGRHPRLDSQWRKKNIHSAPEMVQMSSDQMSYLQQDKELLIEEVNAQKELVWLLHKALEAAQLEKRTCSDFVAAKGEQERLELLRHRERQAADLLGRLEEAKMAAETTRQSLVERDLQVCQLQEDVRMLMEKNNAKQEVIIKLADHVTACTCNPPHSADSFKQLQQHVENLKDDIEAYKTQNKFLNSEIYQLTKLWRKSSEQERSLMVKCADLEARRCQAESRYLGALQKLQENKSLDLDQRQAIQKMIEDALKGEMTGVQPNTNSEHDKYGFKIIPDYEVDDVKLLAKIQALEIRSHNLMQQESRERPLLNRWAQYLAGRSDDALCPSPELKGLLRGGVPHEYRQRVWRWMVRDRTRTIKQRHPCLYQQFCDKSRTCPHPASRQIQLDLHRTLTSNQNFSSPSSPTHQQLQRILLAFSWQNPAIGYCQGLNRLAAIALLVLQSEEDAFWCLVSVVDTIMPQEYYTKNLLASQADQHVFKDILVEKLPRLAAHFDLHGIDVSLVTFSWFLVVFVESLPGDILLPLWDAFLYEGTKVIFRYALALFKYKEEDFLKINDSVDIYQYLRFFTKTVSDGRKLMGIAFGDMNPFPGRLLRNRRAFHLERLQAELRELEEQQRTFEAVSGERKDKELDNTASEDEEELS